MRISDWSSDVCSSDLKGVSRAHHHDRAGGMAGHPGGVGPEQIVAELGPVRGHDDEIDAVAFRKSQDLLVDGAAGDHVPHRNPVGDALAHEGTQVLLRSEEHTSELQSLMRTSYAVFCLQIKTLNCC